MFEARLEQGKILKQMIDAIKDLVNDANFDCNKDGINLQAMDSSHVSLVSLFLNADGFNHFRCDRNASLGLNLESLSKVLKCAGNEDQITLKHHPNDDSVTLMFESKDSERISDFEMKLMDIDCEHLGIPDTEYKCSVSMASNEFQRICRELGTIGDTVTIATTKEGVKFSVKGDLGSGNIMVKPDDGAADEVVKKEDDDDEDEEQDEQEDEGEDGETPKPKKKKQKAKSKKAKAGKKIGTTIELEQKVDLTFALRYLNHFAKATGLSDQVTLKMSPDLPLVVEYKIGNGNNGYIRYYLAPKIEEDNQ